MQNYHQSFHFRKHIEDEIAINVDDEARTRIQELDPRCSRIMDRLEEFARDKYELYVKIFENAEICKQRKLKNIS